MKVEKRDGTIQEFNFEKIERAVQRVFNNKPVCEDVPYKFMEALREHFDKLVKKYPADHVMQIESIQDIIRDMLIKKNKTIAAEAFIKYRAMRESIREQKSWLTKEIAKKLKGSNIENQNANMDEASFGGRMGESGGLVMKDFALKYIVSKKARDNHNSNQIYIHDLDTYVVGCHNCLSVPFDDLLAKGFSTRQTDVRPANSVNTACQLVAVIFQIQSLQQFGGVSATHIDWTMVPYIRKSFEKHYITEMLKTTEDFYDLDILNISYTELEKWTSKRTAELFMKYDLKDEDFYFANDGLDKKFKQLSMYETRKETYQAVEGMYHNLCTLQSRSGNQLPFSSINYGSCPEPEGRLFTRAVLEVSIKGLGKFGRTPIFPCGIFTYKKGINDRPGTPNYDLYKLALTSTSKRLYPNYCNADWSQQTSWVEKDRKDKEDYLSSLTEDERNILIQRLEERPELQEKLGIYVKDC